MSVYVFIWWVASGESLSRWTHAHRPALYKSFATSKCYLLYLFGVSSYKNKQYQMDNFRECLRHTVCGRLEGLKKKMKNGNCGPNLQASHSSLTVFCVSLAVWLVTIEWSDLTVIITMLTVNWWSPLSIMEVWCNFWKDGEIRPCRQPEGSFVVGEMVTTKLVFLKSLYKWDVIPVLAFQPVAPPPVPLRSAAGSSAGGRRSLMFRPLFQYISWQGVGGSGI